MIVKQAVRCFAVLLTATSAVAPALAQVLAPTTGGRTSYLNATPGTTHTPSRPNSTGASVQVPALWPPNGNMDPVKISGKITKSQHGDLRRSR